MELVDPVTVSDFLVAAIAGALVVLFGALYAATFAFGRLYRKPGLLLGAYGFFALLAASLFRLAGALHLNGFWELLVGFLLLGYLLAPHLIWRLAEGTHHGPDGDLTDVNATGGSAP